MQKLQRITNPSLHHKHSPAFCLPFHCSPSQFYYTCVYPYLLIYLILLISVVTEMESRCMPSLLSCFILSILCSWVSPT